MKTLLLLLSIFLLSTICYPQDAFPKASITKDSTENSITYSFKSNYYIPEWKAPQLENRLIDRYQELKTILINSETQTVSFSLNNGVNTNQFIELFVKHFKFYGYVFE